MWPGLLFGYITLARYVSVRAIHWVITNHHAGICLPMHPSLFPPIFCCYGGT